MNDRTNELGRNEYGADRPPRPPTVLVAKCGLDGHDRGALVVARALQDEGLTVYYTGLRASPEDVARQAVDVGADCVGLSTLAGAHLTIAPRLAEALRRAGWRGLFVVGGIVPVADEPSLRAAGVAAVFRPHQSVAEAAAFIRDALRDDNGIFGGNEVG
jgi:methylmalonyl-CoA mutase cobalamin-binding domain/chain